MNMTFKSCLIGVVLAATAGQASAQDSEWKVNDQHAELGAFIGVLFPSENNELFDRRGGSQQQVFSEGAVVGVRAAAYVLSFLGAEVEGALIPVGVDRSDDSALLYRFGGHGILQYPGRISPFVLVGGGAFGVESRADLAGNDMDPAFYWGIGGKYYFDKTFGIRFEARQIHIPSPSNDDDQTSIQHEILLGATFGVGRNSTGPQDRDGDGISDAVDACPDEAAKTSDGCPIRDGDGDGVVDAEDKCPALAGVKPDGCPGDKDGDGVRDDKDECVDEAGTLANGCPDPDPDGDGVKGELDLCPNVASTEPDGCPANDGDKDGVVDTEDKCPETAGVPPDGCPPDADNDGIPDAVDKCVNEAETANGYQDADGCPDEVPAAVKAFTGTIEGINFRTGSSRIDLSSFTVLDGAVKVLKEYPELKMEIGGHTDSSGSASSNERLSKKRAEAVKQYFVSKGIAAERLTAVGYGEANPKAPNSTRAGRAQNRRIEFKLVD